MEQNKQSQSLDSAPYGYWRTLYLSFYSSRLYPDVVKRWQGFGIGYLFLVIALGSIPLSGRILTQFNHFFAEQMLVPFQDLPNLEIKNGEVLFDKPMPYFIKNNQGEVVSIIDTSGKINKISSDYPQLKVLVTKNEINFQPPGIKQLLGAARSSPANKIYSHTFPEGSNGVFDGKIWIKTTGLSKLKIVFELFIFPFVTLFYFAIALLFLPIIATLGQLSADVFLGLKLKFKESCRLLAVSATPLIAFFFCMRTVNMVFPGLGLIYFLILVSYLIYAMYSLRRGFYK